MGKQEHDLSGLVDSYPEPLSPSHRKGSCKIKSENAAFDWGSQSSCLCNRQHWGAHSLLGGGGEILGGWLECERESQGGPGRVRESLGYNHKQSGPLLLSKSEAQLKEGTLLLLLNVGC